MSFLVAWRGEDWTRRRNALRLRVAGRVYADGAAHTYATVVQTFETYDALAVGGNA